MTHLRQINTVMVPVADQDRAVDFYVDRLGLEQRCDIPFEDGMGGQMRWIEVGPAGGGTSIALTPCRGDEWGLGRNTGISLTTSDIDATHAQLRAAGVDVDEQIVRVPGPPPDMFWLRDGDGNTLLVVEAPAG